MFEAITPLQSLMSRKSMGSSHCVLINFVGRDCPSLAAGRPWNSVPAVSEEWILTNRSTLNPRRCSSEGRSLVGGGDLGRDGRDGRDGRG